MCSPKQTSLCLATGLVILQFLSTAAFGSTLSHPVAQTTNAHVPLGSPTLFMVSNVLEAPTWALGDEDKDGKVNVDIKVDAKEDRKEHAIKGVKFLTTPNTPPKSKQPVDLGPIQKERFILFSHFLALNSGFLNGVFLSGIMGKVQAVGPVTDSWTKLGIGMSIGDVSKAAFVVKVLLSFSSGALVAGLLNPRPDLFDLSARKRPLLINGGLMAIATYLVATAAKTASEVPNLAFLLVSAANGMQNSYSSTLSQNLCRTSHFTGTTTDLCTYVGQTMRGNTASQFKIPIYSGMVAMFWFGGLMGARFTTDLFAAATCLSLSSLFYLTSSVPYGKLKRLLLGYIHR